MSGAAPARHLRGTCTAGSPRAAPAACPSGAFAVVWKVFPLESHPSIPIRIHTASDSIPKGAHP